jgi:hypothetical protein
MSGVVRQTSKKMIPYFVYGPVRMLAQVRLKYDVEVGQIFTRRTSGRTKMNRDAVVGIHILKQV